MHKYIHECNRHPGAKDAEERSHDEGEMESNRGKFRDPAESRPQSQKQVVKGEKHYRKE